MKFSGILVTKDKQQIHYDHYLNNHKEAVIIAHGFFNSKDSVLIRKLGLQLQKDFDTIIFDFRGHGQSQGLFSWTAKEHLDLQAVLTYAQKKYKKIGLVGFSLGASIGIITLAKTESVDSLVAISPVADLTKIDYHFWKLDFNKDILYNLGEGREGKGVRPGPFWLKKDTPLKLISRIKIPILYIHGDADWVIKPWHSKILYKQTRSEKRKVILKNGPHAEYLLREYEREIVDLIRDWFSKTLRIK